MSVVNVVANSKGNQPAVMLSHVQKHFGGIHAVNDLSLQVDRATVLALLGPNGAGKTTTVEMCEGFVRPDSGTVQVLGFDPIVNSQAVRDRIGVMLQGGGASPTVRVAEMLHLVASYSAHPLDPSWLMEELGLTQVRKTPYRRLSGGQQQRLSLACALVGRPELVFLDEPTAGLDTQARHLVWELIEALRRDGIAVVLTTHLMEEAEALADQIVIIDHGQLLVSGTAAEIVAAGSAGQARLSAPHAVIAPTVLAQLNHQLSPEVKMTQIHPGSFLITGKLNPQLIAFITTWFAEQDILIRDMKVEQRSLEEVFLELTGKQVRN